ncbi:MAG: tRNA epoxyqueuosine(34) reductase QueG [Acidobacteriia bacterium]|nr:tRNA epoxyqueuosine(34) reductase QueG [Terriglobia bacterium]
MTKAMTTAEIKLLAGECGFELAGVARAEPVSERTWYHDWVNAGFAGEMRYLRDRRAQVRDDPRNLLPSARSVICAGKLYNSPWPYSNQFDMRGRVWISRYAWGGDYHEVLRRGLERLDCLLRERAGAGYESKICVDTAPLLERSFARQAGLGWIGKNTCLINQQSGSWFFLGELLTSLDLDPDAPPPDRCGTCSRCIDACPTAAIVPGKLGHTVDSRLCISYFTIELHDAAPEAKRASTGAHIFGCDICQDVCPWNRRAPVTEASEFQPRLFAPPLERLANISEEEFRGMFGGTPLTRPKYSGFLKNVALAMGNCPQESFRPALERLASHQDAAVRAHAEWALALLP